MILVVSWEKTNHPLRSSLNWTKKQQEQVTSKCERKVVRKFALENEKSMHKPMKRGKEVRVISFSDNL